MEYQIYSVEVGGGLLALSPMPGAVNDLSRDVAKIAAWRADLVIGLVEVEELSAMGVATLPEQIQAAGLDWDHFPIRDYGTPSPEDTAKWDGLRDRALSVLAKGGRVLVHCRGGCGRSGMVVLKLMIASGVPSGEALSRLRDERPCAVETDAQMFWASEGRIHKA